MKKILSVLLVICLVVCTVFNMNTMVYAENDNNQYLNVTLDKVTEKWDFIFESFDLLNEIRVENGKEPLTIDEDLCHIAMQRAKELVVYFSHTRPNGKPCYSLDNVRISGENIGTSTIDSNSAIFMTKAWEESQGHFENMICADYRVVGIGCVEYSGSTYWVQNFGSYAVITQQPDFFDNGDIICENVTIPVTYDCVGLSLKKFPSIDANIKVANIKIGGVLLSNELFEFSSSNLEVASIGEENQINVHSSGTTTITATLTANPKISISREVDFEYYSSYGDGWRFADGTLYITKNLGGIPRPFDAPWYGFSTAIRCIDFDENVSSIGYYRLYNCTNVNTIIFRNPEFESVLGTFADDNNRQWKIPSDCRMCVSSTATKLIESLSCSAYGFSDFFYIDLDPYCTYSHTYEVTTISPTCLNTGYVSKTCKYCSASETEAINPLGHDFESNWTIVEEPTCTSSGSKKSFCVRCNKESELINIEPLGHSYYCKSKEPTCAEDGYFELLICYTCGNTQGEIIPALGHNYSEWEIIRPAGCTISGIRQHECSTCGYTEKENIPVLGHNYVTLPEQAATCTQSGYTSGEYCSVCDKVSKPSTTIPATGHTFSAWKEIEPATCSSTGLKQRTCSSCGEVESTTTYALGHNSSYWIIDEIATYTESGLKHKECTRCGEILETATIPLLKLSTPKLTSASRAATGVKVSWGVVDGADEYIVYRKTSKSGWSRLGVVTTNSFTDTKAKTGTTYYYTVKAQNEAGASGYNKTGLKIKYVAAPKLTKIANESSGVRVHWSKVSGADGYYLYRRVAGSKTWTKIATIKKGSTTSYLDKKASAGKTYEYIIKCYDGSTPSASAAKTIKIKRLTVPKLVSAKSAKAGVTVKWGKVAGAEGYLVYRKTGSGSWVQLTRVEGNAKVSIVDKSAKKGKTYTYTVRAYSGSYKSAYNTKGLKINDSR